MSEDKRAFDPRERREKTHFSNNPQSFKPQKLDFGSPKQMKNEAKGSSDEKKLVTNKFCLGAMNSFSGKSINTVENLFLVKKNLLASSYKAVADEQNSPTETKDDEGGDDVSLPNATPANGKKKVTCNCKKTKCLKLYCDCFAANELCGPECKCCNCFNDEEHESDRAQSIQVILERNPAAFKPKFDKNAEVVAAVVSSVLYQVSLVH